MTLNVSATAAQDAPRPDTAADERVDLLCSVDHILNQIEDAIYEISLQSGRINDLVLELCNLEFGGLPQGVQELAAEVQLQDDHSDIRCGVLALRDAIADLAGNDE